MWFTTENNYLIKCLSLSIKYEAGHFTKMFPDREQSFVGLKTFIRENERSLMSTNRPDNCNISKVLALILWSVSLTHQDFKNILSKHFWYIIFYSVATV